MNMVGPDSLEGRSEQAEKRVEKKAFQGENKWARDVSAPGKDQSKENGGQELEGCRIETLNVGTPDLLPSTQGTGGKIWKHLFARYLHPCVHCGSVHNDRDMETAEVRLDKDVVPACNRIPFNHNKGKILPFATTWIDVENIIWSKISQTEKVKNYMISLLCGT